MTDFNNSHTRSVQRAREKRHAIRQEVMNAYGGAVCECCDESNPGFLTIDHAFNNGTAHRKEVLGNRFRHTEEYFAWLKANNFPKDLGLRVLCWNCNSGRAYNEGVCPHREKKNKVVKLTPDDIEYIVSQKGSKGPRGRRDGRKSLRELANRFGLSESTLYKIQIGEKTSWT